MPKALARGLRRRDNRCETAWPKKRAAISRPPPLNRRTPTLPPSLFELRRDKPDFCASDLLDRVAAPRAQRFFRLDEVLHVALEIELLVGRLRLRRWRRRLVRRDPHVPVILEPGPGRNHPAHRHVLLQAAQVIDLPGDRR